MTWNRWIVVSAALAGGLGLGCGDSSDDPGSGGAGGAQAGSSGQGGSGGTSAGSSSKGGSAGSAAGSGGSAAGTGGSGGGGADPTDSPECTAWCQRLQTECDFECDPSFDCAIDDGECAASTLDWLDCAANEGQLSCGADGFAVIGCSHDETLCN